MPCSQLVTGCTPKAPLQKPCSAAKKQARFLKACATPSWSYPPKSTASDRKLQIERHDGHWAPQAHCRTLAATRVFCASLKSQKALLWLL